MDWETKDTLDEIATRVLMSDADFSFDLYPTGLLLG